MHGHMPFGKADDKKLTPLATDLEGHMQNFMEPLQNLARPFRVCQHLGICHSLSFSAGGSLKYREGEGNQGAPAG